jgi:hypothetical protein
MPATRRTKSSAVGPYELAPQFRVSNHSTAGSGQLAGASHAISLPDDLEFEESIWAHIAEGATPEEVMERAIQGDPYMVVMNLQELQRFIEHKFPVQKKEFVSQYGVEGFPCVTTEMKRWVEEEFPKRGGRPKALILFGPTRTGKTEWARSLGQS